MFQGFQAEGKEKERKEMEKKQGTRKKLFKGNITTTGSNKMRMANAMVSPRKKGAAKSDIRQGEIIKQADNKGVSNPKIDQ